MSSGRVRGVTSTLELEPRHSIVTPGKPPFLSPSPTKRERPLRHAEACCKERGRLTKTDPLRQQREGEGGASAKRSDTDYRVLRLPLF